MIIDVPTSNVTVILLLQHVHFSIGKRTHKDTQFGMSEIDKQNVTGHTRIQLVLPEDTVIQSYGC